jgi:hypothetical protein
MIDETACQPGFPAMKSFLFAVPLLFYCFSSCLGAAETGSSNESCAATNDWNDMHNRILRRNAGGDGIANVPSKGAFLAALDQSGGSTPKALELYGISPSEYETGSER